MIKILILLLFPCIVVAQNVHGESVKVDTTNLDYTRYYGLNYVDGPHKGTMIDTIRAIREALANLDGSYDDVRVALTVTRIPASNYPDWTMVFQNAAESSVGVYSYCFDASTDQYVFFEAQMPHDWWLLDGPVVEPHIHWTKSVHTDTLNVIWGLEFTASTPGESFYDTTFTVYANVHPTVGVDDGTRANVQYLTDWAEIDMTGFSYSTVFICRLFRAATQPLDTYGEDACAVSFDFHYKHRSRGTLQEYGD